MNIVLDTCALIWWSLDPDKLSQSAKDACKQIRLNLEMKNIFQPYGY